MSVIRGFKGYRPTKELCSKVAALPYDVMSSSEAREMVKGNPYSFLHIDRAEIDLPEDVNIYSDEVYAKAAENLDNMIADGTYIQDEKPVMYIYTLTMDGRSQTGLVMCASIDEYLNNKIKKHELTRESKERDRIRHVDACNANTGPIFLTYRENKNISVIIEKQAKNEPEYDFVADDGVRHTVWVIDDTTVVDELKENFLDVDSLYIADGHHRNASAVKVGLKKREEQGENYDRDAEFNYYLAVAFPDNQLHIMDYNRVVKDLNGLSDEEFLNKVEEKFIVQKYEGDGCLKPEKRHTFGMYLSGNWYLLTAKDEFVNHNSPVERLDVSIIYNNLLAPILNIGDARTDKRIDFIGGIRGLDELKNLVDSGKMKVAFSMYPTSMDDLMSIADAGEIMPPKSTWFEPKLRSGIFVHKLS
jgi:uncharacterized protein (DUF1015 family)